MTSTHALLALLPLCLLAARSAAVTIARDGKPQAAIVVPAKATVAERFAAQELQRYLRQISGAQLTIQSEAQPTKGARLFVGATSPGLKERKALLAKDPDAFAVKTIGTDLLLVGATDRSTLYAVYDLLEHDLGCRWLAPGPDWEHVPSKPTIELPRLHRVESPAMKYRFLRMTRPAEPGSWNEHCLSWAAKQRINIGSGWPQLELPESFRQRGGFRAWMAPHSMIPNLLPAKEHFPKHPEWYALHRGKRRLLRRTQLCTTNPEVIDRIATGLGKMFDARPEMDFMGMGQADGTGFCACEKCRALDTGEIWDRGLPVLTERWLTFINAVARKLQKTHPGKKVYTLAYHQTFRPPDPEAIKPEPNVMIQVVNSRPNYVCFVHRFEAQGCPRHAKFRKGLEQWVAMTPGGVMVYEYTPHSTFCMAPFPALHKFVADIKYLHRVGLVGYEGQSGPTAWGTYGIALYAIAKTTWDPTVDAEALLKDYCDHAFGEASEPMQRFVHAVRRGLEAADHITEGIWTYMTPAVMAAARKHLDAAHAAARTDIVRKRLRCYEISFHYGEMAIDAWRTAQKALADSNPALLQQAVARAEAAARFCLDEQAKAPHYAAFPGKLTKVYATRWKRELARMQKSPR